MTQEPTFRIAVDMGGTFTDLVVDDGSGMLRAVKSSTTPLDPAQGILSALMKAALELRLELGELLGRTELLIHGTTRALNALTTGRTARTALVTTRVDSGLIDCAEGSSERSELPSAAAKQYLARPLVVEVDELLMAQGGVSQLCRQEIDRVVAAVADLDVEAIGVCLRRSPADIVHELLLEEVLHRAFPATAITLSHRLHRVSREHQPALSTAIDASLKPLMTAYLGELDARLRVVGFTGRLLIATSTGGFRDAESVVDRPILSVGSSPSMASVAGLRVAAGSFPGRTAIVADTGGTTYDVSLLRNGLDSLETRSIGAGGGSVAWIDDDDVLRVGPTSAGSEPGPACYGLGGVEPTLTDACLVLGYLDPEYFLGGSMSVDGELARAAVSRRIAEPLGIGVFEAAAAIHRLATERMVAGIEELARGQGEDPARSVLVAGGGAGGLTAAATARQLGCDAAIVPRVAPVMSAYGALYAGLTEEFETPWPTASDHLDPGVTEVLAALVRRCDDFIAGPGAGSVGHRIQLSVAARYPDRAGELTVPFELGEGDEWTARLVAAFHLAHHRAFAAADRDSSVEFISWHARVDCMLPGGADLSLVVEELDACESTRDAWFAGLGEITVPVYHPSRLAAGARIIGPAIVEAAMTTVVVEPGFDVERVASGDLILRRHLP